MKPLVVSFYTPTRPYSTSVKKLIKTCGQFGLDYFIPQLQPQASWVRTCAMKGPFVLRCMQRFRRPLLWVDADGFIAKRPDKLYNIKENYDFAVRAESGRPTKTVSGRGQRSLSPVWPDDVTSRWMNTGTIWFNDTDASIELINRWAARCQEKPNDYDQWALQDTWAELLHAGSDLQTLWLPREYCCITKMHQKTIPVIAHRLASAEMRVRRT